MEGICKICATSTKKVMGVSRILLVGSVRAVYANKYAFIAIEEYR